MVQLLLRQAGIAVNAADADGWTALHIARRKKGGDDCVALLLKHQAIDVMAKTNKGNGQMLHTSCHFLSALNGQASSSN